MVSRRGVEAAAEVTHAVIERETKVAAAAIQEDDDAGKSQPA